MQSPSTPAIDQKSLKPISISILSIMYIDIITLIFLSIWFRSRLSLPVPLLVLLLPVLPLRASILLISSIVLALRSSYLCAPLRTSS